MIKFIDSGLTNTISKIEINTNIMKDSICNDNLKDEVQSGLEIIQAIINSWVKKGYNLTDIDRIFHNFYCEKAMQGKKVKVIDGETYKDYIIGDLMETLAIKEKEIEELKSDKANE